MTNFNVPVLKIPSFSVDRPKFALSQFFQQL